jgi:hypothetical protein
MFGFHFVLNSNYSSRHVLFSSHFAAVYVRKDHTVLKVSLNLEEFVSIPLKVQVLSQLGALPWEAFP